MELVYPKPISLQPHAMQPLALLPYQTQQKDVMSKDPNFIVKETAEEKRKSQEKEEQRNHTDWDSSIELLSQSFVTWGRIERQGVARIQQIRDIQESDSWQIRYPKRFELLHTGSRCPMSMLIGRGHFSKVYQKGRQAFKTIKLTQRDEEDRRTLLRMNLKELCFFHSLHHFSIMRAQESQIIMEHGRMIRFIHSMSKARYTLKQVIDTKELTCFQELVHILKGIGKALQYMHKYGIVHGDVKPSNVLVSFRYESILSDFTLTTFPGKGFEVPCASLYWRPPESMMGLEYSPKSDVFSFGVMMMDCLYGTSYFKHLLQIESNEDALTKFCTVMGLPPAEWVDHVNVPACQDVGILQRMTDATSAITLTEEEQKMLEDLLKHMLCWSPQDRWSMDEVMKHPVFMFQTFGPISKEDASQAQDIGQMMNFGNNQTWREPTCEVVWHTEQEKEHISRLVKSAYHEIFQTWLKDGESWLLQDIVVLSKRCIDRLRVIECTFDIKSVIKLCSQFYFFIWKQYWPDQDVNFEAGIYHILHLLEFELFPLKIEETTIQDKLDQEKKAREAQNQSSNAGNGVQFTFLNGSNIKWS